MSHVYGFLLSCVAFVIQVNTSDLMVDHIHEDIYFIQVNKNIPILYEKVGGIYMYIGFEGMPENKDEIRKKNRLFHFYLQFHFCFLAYCTTIAMPLKILYTTNFLIENVFISLFHGFLFKM